MAKKLYVATCADGCGGQHILCAGTSVGKTKKRGLQIANEHHQPLGIVKRELVYIPFKRWQIDVKSVEIVNA